MSHSIHSINLFLDHHAWYWCPQSVLFLSFLKWCPLTETCQSLNLVDHLGRPVVIQDFPTSFSPLNNQTQKFKMANIRFPLLNRQDQVLTVVESILSGYVSTDKPYFVCCGQMWGSGKVLSHLPSQDVLHMYWNIHIRRLSSVKASYPNSPNYLPTPKGILPRSSKFRNLYSMTLATLVMCWLICGKLHGRHTRPTLSSLYNDWFTNPPSPRWTCWILPHSKRLIKSPMEFWGSRWTVYNKIGNCSYTLMRYAGMTASSLAVCKVWLIAIRCNV